MESDFQEFYGVDPLDITWRKLLVLMGGLPARSRLVMAVKMSDPRVMLDIQMGRDPNRQRSYITADQFLGSMSG